MAAPVRLIYENWVIIGSALSHRWPSLFPCSVSCHGSSSFQYDCCCRWRISASRNTQIEFIGRRRLEWGFVECFALKVPLNQNHVATHKHTYGHMWAHKGKCMRQEGVKIVCFAYVSTCFRFCAWLCALHWHILPFAMLLFLFFFFFAYVLASHLAELCGRNVRRDWRF